MTNRDKIVALWNELEEHRAFCAARDVAPGYRTGYNDAWIAAEKSFVKRLNTILSEWPAEPGRQEVDLGELVQR